MKTKLVPSIRFKGFTNAWELKNSNEIIEIYSIKNNQNEQLRSYSVTNTQGFVLQNEFFSNGGTAVYGSKKNSKIISKNSFAFNPSRINVGSIALFNFDDDGLISNIYETFKLKKDVLENYLDVFFKTNYFKHIIQLNSSTGVRSKFSFNDNKNIFMKIPTLPEQEKIYLLINQVKNVVLLLQRKLKMLENIKNTLLEKMFASSKSLYPSVRFKGFTNAWELKRLGELVTITSNKNNGKYNITDFLSVTKVIKSKEISRDVKPETIRNYNVLNYGEIVYEGHETKTNTFGYLAINLHKNGIISNIFSTFRFKREQDLLFWFYFLQNDNIFKHILKRSVKTGIMMHSIDLNMFYKESLKLPIAKTEMNKIGNLFKYIDDVVSLLQRKLKMLENIKNTLLEKMFV
ncbi:restriction endonuclease subunit S [Mycoplasmopsis phocirhinis]|uniref:Restriction endonuclease subunit S n=1 Tax=Mycoplasmopsis phocirhinis TaxID=142650 RepID=A0A4P6MRH6_9BACT|nr:restriction endonuclease subunit S [Mycoplasmopsis phocirhinis]QBF34421.1 restriction endonuclease subunit S [Mycoplasmopsis phocirhinis]